jgi:hyaluronate lyase
MTVVDEFDALRLKWRDFLTGGDRYDPADPIYATAIAALDARVRDDWERMHTAAGRDALWSDTGTGTSDTSVITTSYNRLAEMARAWATRGSAYAGNGRLLGDTIGGLDWLYVHVYHERREERGNWWDWEIGAPLALNTASTLLYDDLSAAQRGNYMRAIDAFTPDPVDPNYVSTGANRVWKAAIVGVRAILVRDAVKLARARDSLSDVFPYVTSGDGFYADGSFIQHDKHPYTGGYGISLLAELAGILYLLADSTWAVTDTGVRNVFAAVEGAFAPVVYRGAMMDMVRGREISRPYMQDHAAGHAAIRAILTLAQMAPPADALAMARLVKGWIQGDTARDFFRNAPLTTAAQARAILDDATISMPEEPVSHRQFPNMDRVVHSRPGFAFGISMSSARIFTYESINGENLRAWYTGDGMTYLYNGDLAQFSDDFWPTVDPYRLPGTTVDTRTRADSSGQSRAPATRWVGGATLLGRSGAVGMDLAAFESTLVAKKSWFLLAGLIVALGAGITSADNRPVETIVENRKLHAQGDNALVVDGVAKPVMVGWSETLPDVAWIALDGAGGYVFPGGATVHALREQRTGSWSDINKATQRPPVTRPYLTLWFDHGANPRDATYAYILLPNANAEEARAYASDPDVTILANTRAVQAIRSVRRGITGANFWQPGTADFIRAAMPLSVMAQEMDGVLTLALADPTHMRASLTLELDRAAEAIMNSDPTITVTQLAPTIKLAANTAGAAGATQSVTFLFR